MLEPDFTKPVPTTSALTELWQKIDFSLSHREYPTVQRYVERLRERYTNGAVLFASFQWPADPVLDWYLSRNNAEGLLFFHRFWHTPTPASILAKLNVPKEYQNDPPFRWSYSFTLAGELASALYQGGAYHHANGTGAEEMLLAEQFSRELIEDRFSEILVYVNHAPWTDFFADIAWDGTWVLFDKRQRNIHVLCATDSD